MNTTTMRQVFVARLNDVTVVDSPIPVPGEGEVRVAVTLAGICGSDTHAIAGHHPLLQPPYYPGHELVGIVDECGAGVAHLKPGQRVMVKPNVECGTCVNCQAGRTNACQTLQWIGCDPSGVQPGGMAEFVVAPVAHVFAIPEGISAGRVEELRIQGSANYTADDIQEAIDIAAAGMVPGDAIVSHSYGIEDAVEAFTVAAQGVAGKVVIDLRRATY